MANTIVLAKNYVPLLDEVYKRESVTADLTGDPAMARAGANAAEIVYPQIAVTGLGDYNRNSGYTQGTVDFKWVSTKYNYDRGAKLSVDAMDNQETYNLAFGMAGAELMRTKVAPEADAFTFATLAGIDGISKGDAKTLADAKAFGRAAFGKKQDGQRRSARRGTNPVCDRKSAERTDDAGHVQVQRDPFPFCYQESCTSGALLYGY